MTATSGNAGNRVSAQALASRLKEAMRLAHQRLDHHPMLAPLVKPGLTRDAYARALAALHGPIALLENMRCPPAFSPPASLSNRSHELEKDLAAMGHAPWPCRQVRPAGESLESWVAARYLLEGSCMGAAVIQRCVARAHLSLPMDYFSVGNAMERWQTFWQWTAHLPPLNADETCIMANGLFDFLCQHMDHCTGLTLAPASALTAIPESALSRPHPDTSYQ